KVIRFTSADEKTDSSNPVFFTFKCDVNQVFCRLFPLFPKPTFIYDGIFRRLTYSLNHVRMLMTQRPTRIARVNDLTTVSKMKINSLSTHYTHDGSLACI